MSLTKEAKQAKREYFRIWRKKNPNKIKKYQEDYWNRQAIKSQKNEVYPFVKTKLMVF